MKFANMLLFLPVICIAYFGYSIVLKNVAPKQTVIILTGTSSAGKSCLARELIHQLGSRSWKIISIDDYITEEFFRQYPNALTDHKMTEKCLKEFQTNGVGKFLATSNIKDRITKQINKCLAEHKNVVIDIAFYEGRDDEFFAQLNDCNVCFVLVYCPLDKLSERVCTRNMIALRSDATIAEKMEKRDLARAIRHFYDLYTRSQDDSFDLITRREVDKTFFRIACEYNNIATPAKGKCSLAAFYRDVLYGIGLKPNDKFVHIKPKFNYDLVVNTGKNDLLTCAEQIIEALDIQHHFKFSVISSGFPVKN